MSLARRLAFAVLGITLGASGGGVAGLLAGLAYTEIAATSGFEGYSGFVVAFWMLGGVVIGMIAGLVVAHRYVRTRAQLRSRVLFRYKYVMPNTISCAPDLKLLRVFFIEPPAERKSATVAIEEKKETTMMKNFSLVILGAALGFGAHGAHRRRRIRCGVAAVSTAGRHTWPMMA